MLCEKNESLRLRLNAVVKADLPCSQDAKVLRNKLVKDGTLLAADRIRAINLIKQSGL